MGIISYYKQQTPYTCALACLRMVLVSFGRETTEVELARVVDFSPGSGVSMPDLARTCEIMNLAYKISKHARIDDIKNFISENLYPIVILKAAIYENVAGEHGHFIIVKDITDKDIVINDPDRIYGGENKSVDITVFTKAWKASKNWLLVVKGEIK